MAYVHCMPARVVILRHGLDNVVSGTLRTHDGEFEFKTRGHIVKATNKIYRNCAWKPSAGDDVLIDAEIGSKLITVDHIERDLGAKTETDSKNPHLDIIAGLLPKHPPATKTLRVWRKGGPIRVRFAEFASRIDRRDQLQDEVIHAIYEDDRWTLWTVTQQGGNLSTSGIDAVVLPILARASGMDLISGETEREKRQAEKEPLTTTVAAPANTAPFEDCPF